MNLKNKPATIAGYYELFGNAASYAQSPFLLLVRLYWGLAIRPNRMGQAQQSPSDHGLVHISSSSFPSLYCWLCRMGGTRGWRSIGPWPALAICRSRACHQYDGGLLEGRAGCATVRLQ